MKKQILSLALCAVVAAGAFSVADAACARTQAKAKPACATCKNQNQKFNSPEEAKKAFESKMMQKREQFYSDLGLNDAQKTKAKALDEKTKSDMKALHKKFKEDRQKIVEAYKKDFEAILSKEQKAKYDKMEQERKAKFEKMKMEHKGMAKAPCPQGPPPCGAPEKPDED